MISKLLGRDNSAARASAEDKSGTPAGFQGADEKPAGVPGSISLTENEAEFLSGLDARISASAANIANIHEKIAALGLEIQNLQSQIPTHVAARAQAKLQRSNWVTSKVTLSGIETDASAALFDAENRALILTRRS